MSQRILQTVAAFIRREIKLEPQEDVLVGISGGADSTALLLILKELGYNLRALHCNFQLRGSESQRDQAFVEQLCRQQNVPLTVRQFQTSAEARCHGISIEMAARRLRYDWFREEQSKAAATNPSATPPPIAVAHHRDDQAETLLLNLLRGTGLRGMAGMHPEHHGIIRPLLCIGRQEIQHFLEEKKQTYVTDSTNNERIAQRNRLRLDVLPLLNDISPRAAEKLSRAAENARSALPYYELGIAETLNRIGATADRLPLHALRSPALLHEWLTGKGFNRTQEQEIREAEGRPPGRIWTSPSGYTVLHSRDALHLSAPSRPLPPPALHQTLVTRLGTTGPHIAYLDADLLDGPIEVRPVRPGDRFVPFGMTGHKLVSDFLTDHKATHMQKAEAHVAVSGGHIVWLIGWRSDNRYRITEHTRRILKLYTEK